MPQVQDWWASKQPPSSKPKLAYPSAGKLRDWGKAYDVWLGLVTWAPPP